MLAKSVPIVAETYRRIRWSRFVANLTPNPRRNLNRFIIEATRNIVLSGPFSGMKVLPYSSWGDGDIAPKLLGTYEQELHAILYDISRKSYEAAVDIGCAEGFYAVGIARLLGRIPVYAYDIDPKAREVTARAAEENDVATVLKIGEACSPDELIRLSGVRQRLFIVSDCEGYEKDLFGNPDVMRALDTSDILIECHDSDAFDCTEYLRSFIGKTHKVSVITAGGRNPNSFEFLTKLNEIDRWQAVNENRPYSMKWLWCEAIEQRVATR